MGRSRTQSQTYVTSAPSTPQPQQIQSPVYQEPVPAVISPPPPPIQVAPAAPVAQLPPPPPPVAIPIIPAVPVTAIASQFVQQPPIPNPIAIEKRRAAKTHSTSKKNKKNRGNQQVSTKDLGRWKPIDDLALIIGIQQTNDLRTVHRGVKFSCKFTVQELQNRWYSLLYDEPISRIAVAAMRNLHPEMVETVQSKALYTTQEEELLGTIKSVSAIDKSIVRSHRNLTKFSNILFADGEPRTGRIPGVARQKRSFILPIANGQSPTKPLESNETVHAVARPSCHTHQSIEFVGLFARWRFQH